MKDDATSATINNIMVSFFIFVFVKLLYTKLLTANTKNEISALEKPYIKKCKIGRGDTPEADFNNSTKQISNINRKCAHRIDYQAITPPIAQRADNQSISRSTEDIYFYPYNP